MIYLVYAGAGLESYMTPLQPLDTYSGPRPPIPTPGWRTLAADGQGKLDPLHLAKGFGSVQIVMRGAVRIGVTAGDFREWVGRPGDAFIFIDLEGKGHEAQRIGFEPFEAINIRLSGDWDALKGAFANWPADARPFPEGITLP